MGLKVGVIFGTAVVVIVGELLGVIDGTIVCPEAEAQRKIPIIKIDRPSEAFITFILFTN